MSTLHRTIAMLAALAFTAASLALAAPGAARPGAQGDTPAQKVIKDPAEYNAYITALNLTDPPAKAAAMEAFIVQYPNSVMKTDALQQALQAYQAAGNPQKVQITANRILEIDPNDLRAEVAMRLANASTKDRAWVGKRHAVPPM